MPIWKIHRIGGDDSTYVRELAAAGFADDAFNRRRSASLRDARSFLGKPHHATIIQKKSNLEIKQSAGVSSFKAGRGKIPLSLTAAAVSHSNIGSTRRAIPRGAVKQTLLKLPE